MKKPDSRLRTLDFHGQPIYYLALPEGNLVLIRPLCDLLGVHADWQVEAIKEDEILGAEHGVHRVQLPNDTQSRKHFCLPERFIYGWVFGIQYTNTMKPETRAQLTDYKRECYNVLFDHFHGRLNDPQELDKEEAIINLELWAVEKRLKEKLQADPDHQRLQELETKMKAVKRAQAKNRQQSRQSAFEFVVGSVAEGEAEAGEEQSAVKEA